MIEKFKQLFLKYKEIIMYIIFGGMTTVINIVVCMICADWMKIHYMIANVIAWILSVLFAYVTNRRWVFQSKAKGIKSIAREIVLFVSARLLSLAGDMVILFVCVDMIGLSVFVSKIFSNVFVVIFNYIFSKLIIFKRK